MIILSYTVRVLLAPSSGWLSFYERQGSLSGPCGLVVQHGITYWEIIRSNLFRNSASLLTYLPILEKVWCMCCFQLASLVIVSDSNWYTPPSPSSGWNANHWEAAGWPRMLESMSDSWLQHLRDCLSAYSSPFHGLWFIVVIFQRMTNCGNV